MFCVALTGNIASGKSTVATEFACLGIEIISADVISRQLTTRENPVLAQMVQHFGAAILDSSGELNRRYLRQLVFNDRKQRVWLEELLHPLIRHEIEQRIGSIQSPYCLIEIPLIPDKAHYPYLDRILLVIADREQQITRIMARDTCSREHALAIIATQADESHHRAIADDVLLNNDTLASLQKQVAVLHEQYLQYASNTPPFLKGGWEEFS